MEKYTDQEFFYKQTPVNYDGIAKLTSIKGNTLGWNQLVENGNFANGTTGWTQLSATLSVTNKICRATFTGTAWNNDIRQTASFPSGHKYFISLKYRASSSRVGDLNLIIASGGTQGNNYKVLPNVTTMASTSFILTPTSNVIYWRISLVNDQSTNSGEFIEVTDFMAIDLTQMGLDISNPSEFTSLFPLPYYDYNQGTLIPFSGNGIKTVGFNQWDEEWEVGEISTTNGENVAGSNIIRSKNYIPVFPNTVYYFKTGNTAVNTYRHFYDADKNYLGYVLANTNSVLTTPTNACYMRFRLGTAYGATYNNDICINISSDKNGTYEPYTESITDLPISTYFPTGMKRAGNVYDELTESKAITRVGSRAYQSGDENNANYATDGTTTYYPLATPTETDAEDIFYKFYADGTEQLLPVNGSTPTTSYLIADIEYYDSTEGDSLYRRFWLINGDGERWDLTDKEFRSFLNNPTGLGFRKTIEVTRYGEKANKNNEVYDFPQPSGELLFYDTYNSTRYDKYNKFIRFLMSQPITLYYMIPVSYISGIANIFTLNCDVTEVQKTESKTDRILTSSIVFNGLGFYEGDEISVNGTTDTYTLTNEGDFPVGFEITVEGSLTKPYITLSQDGELYGEAKFVGTQAYNSLYVNSNDGEQNIILQHGGSVIPNPLSYQDLSISNGSIYVTFVKLAKGVSELSIGVESGSISNVNIKYSPKYRSV